MSHFHPQGFAETFDGEFGGAVITLIRDSEHSGYAAECDYLPGPLRPHIRKNCLDRTDQPHEIHIHLELYVLFGGEFQRPSYPGTGIVHQNVDSSLFADERLYGTADLSLILHIHSEVTDAGLFRNIPADSPVHRMAAPDEFLRCRQAEARRYSGDENDHISTP